jgi:hemolysin III
VPASERPRLRGVLHHYAFLVSLAAGTLLAISAPTGHAFAAALVYATSLSALLGVSALFHRVTWSVASRRWMARLDHSMIAVLIAGTFTPFAMVAVDDPLAVRLLAVIWAGAAAGIVLHLFWIDMPKWISAVLYVLLGWVGIVAAPQVVAHAGWTVFGLLLGGGLIYSAGAIVYAVRRPDPLPAVFGYHEVFHALVVVAAATHYAAVAITIL